MSNKREILLEKIGQGEWFDSFIMCPSQCYYYFKYKEKEYQIYLRWRHEDPWSVTLIEVEDEEWYTLDDNSSFWTHDEHESCKEEAVKNAYKFIRKNF